MVQQEVGGNVVVEEVLHSVNSLKMCSSVLIGSKHPSSFYSCEGSFEGFFEGSSF